jgi:hypothetical protein
MALPWSFVSKITNSKHQITNKSQIPIFNDQNLPGREIVFVLDFEFRSLFFVCFLGFVIWNFNKSMNFQQRKSPLGITKAWSSGPGFLRFGD